MDIDTNAQTDDCKPHLHIHAHFATDTSTPSPSPRPMEDPARSQTPLFLPNSRESTPSDFDLRSVTPQTLEPPPLPHNISNNAGVEVDFELPHPYTWTEDDADVSMASPFEELALPEVPHTWACPISGQADFQLPHPQTWTEHDADFPMAGPFNKLALPVVPHTWARPISGRSATGKLVLVISPGNTYDAEFIFALGCDTNEEGYNICRGEEDAPYTRREVPRVEGIPEGVEFAAYCRTLNTFLLCVPATWNTPALTAGDRIAVLNGDLIGATGFIWSMEQRGTEMWAQVQRCAWDQYSPEVFRVKLEDVAR
ncbi:hypothetical protein K438DRAFT_1770286 [Mycena galopus ATCC 62051]|nr:hypothetical protein K438DRAFT_1770286 [Mycena galopus ATCC 62051]